SHPGSDVDRDPADVVPSELDLTGVEADPHVGAGGAEPVPDRHRATDRTRGCVEQCEEPVPGRLDLPPSVGSQLRSNELIVTIQHVAPAAISDLGGALRR